MYSFPGIPQQRNECRVHPAVHFTLKSMIDLRPQNMEPPSRQRLPRGKGYCNWVGHFIFFLGVVFFAVRFSGGRIWSEIIEEALKKLWLELFKIPLPSTNLALAPRESGSWDTGGTS
jgi:hypothetical protein